MGNWDGETGTDTIKLPENGGKLGRGNWDRETGTDTIKLPETVSVPVIQSLADALCRPANADFGNHSTFV